MGSKEAKEITMSTLYSASPTAIKAWRRKRKAYLKEVRIYNAGHAIKRSVRPVKDFVDEVIWEAVSKKKLHPHHRTQKRQDPNHVECANYILGIGEYKGLIQEDHKDPLVVLKSVKYQKGRAGATHEDRWFSYISRRDKALEKIPEPQLSNKVFQRAHAKHIRNVLRPKVLKQAVAEAFRTGIHPGTEKYHAEWLLNTKDSVANTEDMIEAIIEYCDARTKEGLMSKEWDVEDTTRNKKIECKNWKKGTCTRGDKCRYKHVGSKGSGTGAKNSNGNHTTQKGTGKPLGPENKQCPTDKKGEKCQYGSECYFAHRHPTNPHKDAKPRKSPRDHSNSICKACGKKGHIMWKCDK